MVADAVPDAMRRAFTQVEERPPAPGAGRDPVRRHDRGRPRAAELHAGPARAVGARPAGRVPKWPTRWSRPSGRSSTPARASTTPRPGTTLRELAELLEAPVTTSLEGKSAFPEDHPLSLGVGRPLHSEGGAPLPGQGRRHLRHRLQLRHDQLRRAPCRATGQTYIHATLDPADLNKDMPIEHALLGDAELTLERADRRGQGSARRQAARPCGGRRGRRSRSVRDEWLAEWKPQAHLATTRRCRPTA